MHRVDFFSRCVPVDDPDYPEIPSKTSKAICAVTGEERDCLPRKDVFGKSFTNSDVLLAPSSQFISVNSVVALRWKWQRCSSWFCDGIKVIKLDRKGVRRYVFMEEMPESWMGYATTSYKKHGVLKAKINTGSQRFWLFEMRQVDLSNFGETIIMWNRLNSALRLGFSRTVLETLECPSYVMNKCGVDAWLDFESWARHRYLSAQYSFLCYLLPSQDELKAEKQEKGVE